jgi:hypothetical protein
MLRTNNMCLLPFFAFGTSNGAAIESSFSSDGYENKDFNKLNIIVFVLF